MYNTQFIAESLKDENLISHLRKKKCYLNNLLKMLIKTWDSYEYTTGNFILFLIRISGIMRLTNEYIFSDVCEIFRNLILETRNQNIGIIIR